MFQLKPGTLALIIGAKTSAGRGNIGKTVELFHLCQPGEVFINPINGFTTMLPKETPRALWLVTGRWCRQTGSRVLPGSERNT